jgi:hypothetical protein
MGGGDRPEVGGDARAEYVFTVRFRVDGEGVRLDPSRFETTLRRPADPPGEEGWLFFRDNLWRGEVGDEGHVKTLTEDTLGVAVESVSFEELRTEASYLDDLKAEIGRNLGAFNADDATAALSKYLGSSMRVVDAD